MPRSEREGALLRLAEDVGKLALVARTVVDAQALAKRLTLSGMPIRLATEGGQTKAATFFANGHIETLVTTHDYIIENGPLSATVVVHTRLPATPRAYLRRLSAIQAPLHVTLVLPEDERSAIALFPQIVDDATGAPKPGEPLDAVLDLTTGGRPAAVAGGRRRFPLVR